jgi:hypothetical protein
MDGCQAHTGDGQVDVEHLDFKEVELVFHAISSGIDRSASSIMSTACLGKIAAVATYT